MIRATILIACLLVAGTAVAFAQVSSGVQQVPSGVSQVPATSAPSLAPPPTPGPSSIPGPLIQSGRAPGAGSPGQSSSSR